MIYGLSGEDAMDLAERLFEHRPNKGKKLAGARGIIRNIPQVKSQIDQVIRILS